MSSSYDLYKGMSQSKWKYKTPGESSQQPPKKSRTEEPSTAVPETASAVPEVEILETPRRVSSPPAQVVEEPAAEVMDEPPPAEEPVVEGVAQVFESVIQMATERVQKLAKHKKYAKAASSFPGYNFGQAFSRGLNDVSVVSSPRSDYLMFS